MALAVGVSQEDPQRKSPRSEDQTPERARKPDPDPRSSRVAPKGRDVDNAPQPPQPGARGKSDRPDPDPAPRPNQPGAKAKGDRPDPDPAPRPNQPWSQSQRRSSRSRPRSPPESTRGQRQRRSSRPRSRPTSESTRSQSQRRSSRPRRPTPESTRRCGRPRHVPTRRCRSRHRTQSARPHSVQSASKSPIPPFARPWKTPAPSGIVPASASTLPHGELSLIVGSIARSPANAKWIWPAVSTTTTTPRPSCIPSSAEPLPVPLPGISSRRTGTATTVSRPRWWVGIRTTAGNPSTSSPAAFTETPPGMRLPPSGGKTTTGTNTRPIISTETAASSTTKPTRASHRSSLPRRVLIG
jgi:hypothetical protein